MHTIEVDHISKSFGDTRAVDDVSFKVNQGEIFGLLGPNGAGKTTTIRIMLDILRPDAGEVSILDGPMTEEKKNDIGYMPEERGLYMDITLERCLAYLGALKGLSSSESKSRVDEYLERFDLAEHRKKKLKELSKGMQQKAQIIASIIHHPRILIIDEPFTSLDPMNTRMVKDLMREIRNQGTTILMSTHQLHQVEELCDRILLINEGKDVLYGQLAEIRKRYSGNDLWVRVSGGLPALKGITEIKRENHDYRLILEQETSSQHVLNQLIEQEAVVEKFEVALPSLDEIFIRVVKEGK